MTLVEVLSPELRNERHVVVRVHAAATRRHHCIIILAAIAVIADCIEHGAAASEPSRGQMRMRAQNRDGIPASGLLLRLRLLLLLHQHLMMLAHP